MHALFCGLYGASSLKGKENIFITSPIILNVWKNVLRTYLDYP